MKKKNKNKVENIDKNDEKLLLSDVSKSLCLGFDEKCNEFIKNKNCCYDCGLYHNNVC